MEDVHVLYSMVVGGNELLPQNDPEIRHISFYLWELLFKDYNEIKTEAKELNAEDQNARTVLHKLVEDSMPGAMKNIRTISGVVDEVGNLAKSVLEIQNLSAKISTYNTDNASESECSLRDNVVDSLNRNNGDCLNVLVDLYHEILQVTDRERIPLLIAYEGLIQDLSKVQDGTVVKVLKDNVSGLKRKLEQELHLKR
ncbi:methyl-coenzyme M reductase subunit delta, putative [Babesia ovis]|uniref:Methyl-coenzyme M reductase subunit delta, putative n=1 Tax=Babesia ovis TaxID=5869 RepID=A0A9W5WTE8_BABOV|nr:methyl-coenzyme M reductase subunit delta, putative [Babesia ovis]